jgi:sigma-70-like protein
MSSLRIGRSHKARKALFTRGIRRGFLTVGEIDEALPPGSLTDAERWLLYYSLHAARVEVLDRRGKRVELEDLRSSRDELQGEGEGDTTQQ